MAILGSKDQSSCLPRFIFQKSVTWACPVAMEAFVYVIGAGGSGAHVGHSSDTTHNCNGGGAGGCAISRLSLVAQNYTVTIGSGGARTDGNNNGSSLEHMRELIEATKSSRTFEYSGFAAVKEAGHYGTKFS